MKTSLDFDGEEEKPARESRPKNCVYVTEKKK